MFRAERLFEPWVVYLTSTVNGCHQCFPLHTHHLNKQTISSCHFFISDSDDHVQRLRRRRRRPWTPRYARSTVSNFTKIAKSFRSCHFCKNDAEHVALCWL